MLRPKLKRIKFDTDELPELDERKDSVGAVQTPETVSQLTARIQQMLEGEFVDLYVVGQISGWRGQATSGHAYFSIKDESALISCVIWKYAAMSIDLRGMQDGTLVEIRGKISLYPPKGGYQIVVQSMQKTGQGLLWQKFEQMKAKLRAEGLFDADRKKPIPPYPAKVGVVTAITGAAVKDIISILQRRAPQICLYLYNSRMQGDGAAQEVAHGIEQLNRVPDLDVLIIARGGGSLEELWTFNEEVVARAIIASRIPVISAVGHEIDFSIADFVADLRAATPSAAAEIISQNTMAVADRLDDIERRMRNAMSSRLRVWHGNMQIAERLYLSLPYRMEKVRTKLNTLQSRLEMQSPQKRIELMRQRLDDYQDSMRGSLQQAIDKVKHKLEMYDTKLNALNPFAVLNRGYSIVYDPKKRKVITSAVQAPPDTVLKIQFEKDSVKAIVTSDDKVSLPIKKRQTRAQYGSSMMEDLFGDLDD